MRKPFVFMAVAGVLIFAWVFYMWWPKADERPARKRPPSSPARASQPSRPPARPDPDQAVPTPPPPRPIANPAPLPGDGPPPPGLVARVNGEPIYLEDINSGIDRGRFGLMLKDASRGRLEVLISIVTLRQYLRAEGIRVPEKEVESELAELKKNPPSAGCACCRYSSLEEFLSSNLMTMNDLRESIRNEKGLVKKVDAMWNADYPAGEKRKALVAKERRRVLQAYMKASHVFFNTVQQPDYDLDPHGVRERAKAKARAAWERIRKGEDFAKVARDSSEDAFSFSKGGSLGCIPRNAFGRAIEDAAGLLKPGAHSGPIESPWGWHVIRLETMDDRDVLEIVESEYKDRKMQDLYAAIRDQAKVERFNTNSGRP